MNDNNEVIAKNILIRSGLKDINNYIGHNVNRNDLNTVNLMCVFRDLVGIDPMYALEFIDLVNGMKVLSAFNFINKFNIFANNGFNSEGLIEMHNKDNSLLTMFDLYEDKNTNVNDLIISASIKSEFIKNTLEYAKKLQREYSPKYMENEIKKTK